MKKQIDKVKRVLLICGCALLILAGLTACTDDEYNKEGSSSQGSTTENPISDTESEESDSDDNVYEYQQEVDDEGGGSGEAEFGYSFSDDAD